MKWFASILSLAGAVGFSSLFLFPIQLTHLLPPVVPVQSVAFRWKAHLSPPQLLSISKPINIFLTPQEYPIQRLSLSDRLRLPFALILLPVTSELRLYGSLIGRQGSLPFEGRTTPHSKQLTLFVAGGQIRLSGGQTGGTLELEALNSNELGTVFEWFKIFENNFNGKVEWNDGRFEIAIPSLKVNEQRVSTALPTMIGSIASVEQSIHSFLSTPFRITISFVTIPNVKLTGGTIENTAGKFLIGSTILNTKNLDTMIPLRWQPNPTLLGNELAQALADDSHGGVPSLGFTVKMAGERISLSPNQEEIESKGKRWLVGKVRNLDYQKIRESISRFRLRQR